MKIFHFCMNVSFLSLVAKENLGKLQSHNFARYFHNYLHNGFSIQHIQNLTAKTFNLMRKI